MTNRTIQIKKRNGDSWDNLYPITLSDNVFNQNGKSVSSQLEGVTRNYKEKKARFCLVDDDGRSEVYSVLRPLLNNLGVKGTLAIHPAYIGNEGRLTKTQILELKNEGWEIISHSNTHTHLTELTDSQIHEQLSQSKQALKNMGIETNAIAYPNGDYNSRVVEIVKQYYDLGLTVGNIANDLPLNTYAINRIGVGAWGLSSWTLIKDRIDQTIERGTLGVIMTHVGDNDQSDNNLITETIQYIKSLGYTIETLSNAYEKTKNILDYGVFTDEEDNNKFSIAYDGTLGYDQLRVLTKPANTFNGSSKPRDFKNGYITYNFVTNKNANGLPENVGGMLITNRLAGDTNSHFQIYKIHNSNRVYINKATSIDSWGEFRILGNTFLDDRPNKLDLNSPFSEYPIGTTKATVSNANAGAVSPTGTGGTIITEKPSTTVDYGFQLFHPTRSNAVYKRHPTSNTNWSPFTEL